MALSAGDVLIVHKLDEKGREVWRYPGRLIESSADRIVLEAEFERESIDVGGLKLRRGDRFVETFYRDRWYNVFAVHDGDGPVLKGWYCNIARPARIEGGDVYAEDLALDLIVLPNRAWRVLDEGEFKALGLSAFDREQALHALAELQAKARVAEEPFESGV
jgi:predicted RNA-binding protein associated with RNAse of E/G family